MQILSRLILVFLLVVTQGCGSDTPAQKSDSDVNAETAVISGPPRARNRNLIRDGFTVESVDINSDERPDQWTYKSGAKIVRIERDINFDDRIDMWQYPGEDGTIVEEEMDLDLDGIVDVVTFFENGVIVRKESSIDFQQGFSIAKIYDGKGNLLRVERDEDGDNRPDIWEYYEGSRRVRVGWDSNGDGIPDKFDSIL